MINGDVLVDPATDDSTPTDPDALVMYLLFDRPPDHPTRVIVVRNVLRSPGTMTRLHWLWPFPSVEHAAMFLEQHLGLTYLPRDESDVASLVGTWI
jgi:hypothetical protein